MTPNATDASNYTSANNLTSPSHEFFDIQSHDITLGSDLPHKKKKAEYAIELTEYLYLLLMFISLAILAVTIKFLFTKLSDMINGRPSNIFTQLVQLNNIWHTREHRERDSQIQNVRASRDSQRSQSGARNSTNRESRGSRASNKDRSSKTLEDQQLEKERKLSKNLLRESLRIDKRQATIPRMKPGPGSRSITTAVNSETFSIKSESLGNSEMSLTNQIRVTNLTNGIYIETNTSNCFEPNVTIDTHTARESIEYRAVWIHFLVKNSFFLVKNAVFWSKIRFFVKNPEPPCM